MQIPNQIAIAGFPSGRHDARRNNAHSVTEKDIPTTAPTCTVNTLAKRGCSRPVRPERSVSKHMKNAATWFHEKIGLAPYRLKRAATVTEEWVRHTGGRIMHGNVTLSAEPSTEFAYRSEVEWPDRKHPEMYETCVFHGIMDVLFTSQHAPVLGITIVLKQIRWDNINSCAFGFYEASRVATEKILVSGNTEPAI